MLKTKRGVNPLIASYRRLLIEELIAGERQKEQIIMTELVAVTFRLNYGQVPVEFELHSSDENALTGGEIMKAVDHFIGEGFTAPTYIAKSGDKLDKKGTVISIAAVPNTKMYEVTGKLDDNGGEFKWREFTATTFRKNDRFKVIKNDRGFLAGQMIIDDEQQEFPL